MSTIDYQNTSSIVKLTGSEKKIFRTDSLEVIIDSDLTFEQSVSGINAPAEIIRNLELVEVKYYSFDKKIHQGQLVIHKSLSKDIQEIFEQILKNKFLVEKVIPIIKYNWSDEESMRDNNTSAFNYRFIRGTKILTAHGNGSAIDINPFLNPHIKKGKAIPEGAEYNPQKEGTITAESFLVKEFRKRGWQWGGNWRSSKDYQHFQKKIR
jgi:hypothetical protein